MIKINRNKYEENVIEQKTITKKVKVISAIVLTILPILSPYAFFGPITLNMIIMGVSVFFLVIFKAKINKNIVIPVSLLWTTHMGLSLFSTFITTFNISLINSIVLISYSVLCISFLWCNCDFEIFTKYANFFGVISCIFIFIQAIFLAIGLEPPTGRLFNLKLLDYAGFVTTTWGFRLNSIFQEPSYFAVFSLPLLAISLKKNKFKLYLLYTIALILSSSSLGIIGAIIITVEHFLIEKRNIKQLLLIIMAVFIFHIIMYSTMDYYYNSFNRSLDKLLSIFESSNDTRLTGQVALFNYLPIINQIIGVGVNQMQNYFSGIIYGVYNYSNSFVVTLINTGIIGVLMYLIFIFYTVNRAKKTNRLIFVLIFIMVATTDYFIYNYFFFYILTFIYLNNESRVSNENIIRNIESNRNKLVSYNK
ncbi:O-antigen ligase family protein [Haloimpatiens lingqiaonensis]|uniref:O-antigen ligase family protein n=1 Tax=Haloimpatiens lingqiaonensis TaxID=1380675 RepID=UPI0010FEAA6B|nr:O-antigen ligase family protein [Haloimpatiens lingqiaonensis]